MSRHLLITCVILIALSSQSWSEKAVGPRSSGQSRQLIVELKESPKGPFSGIQWYCKDGSVHPAPGNPCSRRGGGIQHGAVRPEVAKLQDQGFQIATIFGAVDEQDVQNFARNPHLLASAVLERFLVQFDDGWIFRNARYYRGAAQVEDEVEGLRRLFAELVGSAMWRNEHFLLLREAYRRLPLSEHENSFSEIRSHSKRLATSYSSFVSIKNKIHSYPDAGDAERVRLFARTHPIKNSAQFEALADLIDRAYSSRPLSLIVEGLHRDSTDSEQRRLLSWARDQLSTSDTPLEQYQITARLLQLARDEFMDSFVLDTALRWLALSEAAERHLFTLREPMLSALHGGSRIAHVRILEASFRAAYATGLLSNRAFRTMMVESTALVKVEIPQDEYVEHISNLGRVIQFAGSSYEWEFGGVVEQWSELEPMVHEFIPDSLRASPIAVYSEIFAKLQNDTDKLQKLHHEFFGKQVISSELAALNPGVAHGILVDPMLDPSETIDPEKSIYLVPQTIATLPRVAGIITKDAGNPVSHVQLLARNLGIPNVVVSSQLLPRLNRLRGTEVFVASSPGGRVFIDTFNSSLREKFEKEKDVSEKIEIDVDDLDLENQSILSLAELKEKDSQELVGPKAGKLSELKALFPSTVSPGIVLPFGVFAKVLNAKLSSGERLSDWMKQQYKYLEDFPGSSIEKKRFTQEMLVKIRTAILSLRFNQDFVNYLRSKMAEVFGPEGTYGVFVRSDTNVEDLPNFSGAGLNKTVPNVVQFSDIVNAIIQVYASPFTERAFSWRQASLENPEHVYVSVLIQKTVPVDLSGVLITKNVFNGNTDELTIATNEGVGGVVNNQRAEVVLVDRETGIVEMVSEACEASKKIINPEGGVSKVRTSNDRRVLYPEHLKALLTFVNELFERYYESDIFDRSLFPADVEFGFVGNRLALFQIRPFVESSSAQSSKFLLDLDDDIDDSSRDILMRDPLIQ